MLIGYAQDDPEVKARLAAFRAGLAKRGWSEGGNVQIDTVLQPEARINIVHLRKS